LLICTGISYLKQPRILDVGIVVIGMDPYDFDSVLLSVISTAANGICSF
jgi:hypothetical protein